VKKNGFGLLCSGTSFFSSSQIYIPAFSNRCVFRFLT
jgi:hypothetical protein